MNNLSGDTVTLSQLVRTEEHGLNVNRLLFAKFLVMTGRINEGDVSNPRTMTRIPDIEEAKGISVAPSPTASAKSAAR
jgi:hypothetical protein